ncbi:MAG TPA: glycosyltransferase family 39 protein [Gaiellaceae bacterium]|nr:glycosyltransferase family 39 protein [Gaiellaceae bacterium]
MADFSFGRIFHVVSTQRGGGPLHFWLEHVLLTWWPGLWSLRLTSLVFICLALPAVALAVRRLRGDVDAAAVVVLVAVSPIPVLYATFGRPHTLLFAWLMWATVLALRAADAGDRRLWAAAGAALGLTVFVHPTAPLYALTAFGAAMVYAWRPPRVVLAQAWPGIATLLVTFAPYYLATLHVLSDRYGVGAGRGGRTFSGRPVWADALHFVAPGKADLNWFTALAAAGTAALLLRRQWRVVAFCVLTVLAPVVFFSVVPTNGISALFFDRYMIPVTPAFLVLVVAAIVEVARLARRLQLVLVGAAVAWLVVVSLHPVLRHRRHLERIDVNAVVAAVAHEPAGTVLFGSTGTSGAIFSSFDFGHPANVLDHLVALRVPALTLVDDDACQRVLPFLHGPQRPRRAVWLFYAASPDEAAAARAALGVAPVAGRYFVVRSAPLPPRALIRQGLRLRLAWQRAVPLNRRVAELVQSDRELLAGSCTPYGVLGDPDIDPVWPPLPSVHQ